MWNHMSSEAVGTLCADHLNTFLFWFSAIPHLLFLSLPQSIFTKASEESLWRGSFEQLVSFLLASHPTHLSEAEAPYIFGVPAPEEFCLQARLLCIELRVLFWLYYYYFFVSDIFFQILFFPHKRVLCIYKVSTTVVCTFPTLSCMSWLHSISCLFDYNSLHKCGAVSLLKEWECRWFCF